MDEQTNQSLKQRYHYADWKSASGLVAPRNIEGLIRPGTQLNGWQLFRVNPILVPRAQAAYRSMWRSASDPSALLHVDVMEMTETGAAHELLIELLGEFQSPQVEQDRQRATGDVAFVVPGGTATAFARANVVATVRNAGRHVVPVDDFARHLDETFEAGIHAGRSS